MNENGKFRKKTGYTIAGNTLTRDSSISLKAKGLYLVIMSYITIPNFELTKSFVFKQCKEGEKSFESSWNELKEAGYLKVYFYPGKNGFQSEYELLDEPDLGPHTFYLDNNGQIKSTNIDRKNKKSSTTSPQEEEKEAPVENLKKQNTQKKKSYPQSEGDYRYPQKGGNGNSSQRTPHFGSNANGINANGGNNNNTNNKPINNNIINLSINKINTDGQMDNSAEDKKENGYLDYSYANDSALMSKKIKELCDYEYYSCSEEYTSMEQETYNLIVDCLIEMSSDTKIQKYGTSSCSYKNVIDQINQICKDSEVNSLHLFVEITMEDYINHIKTGSDKGIKDVKKYLKTCIWNSFSTYKMKWLAYFEKTYSEWHYKNQRA